MWNRYIVFVALSVVVLIEGCVDAPAAPTATASPPMVIISNSLPSGDSGTFVLVDAQQNLMVIYNPDRAGERLPPQSTFKLPNALIALETGAIEAHNSSIEPHPDDPIAFPQWAGRQTVDTAIRYSVVWYFQEVARHIGEDDMQHYLNLIEYGNRDISGGIDQFWLQSSLKISAVEQVHFIQALHQGTLPFAEPHMEIVRKAIILEQTEQYTLYGKTGTAQLSSERHFGWLVGYVEWTDGDVYYYALNLEATTDFESFGMRRMEQLRALLQAHAALPTS